MISVRQSAFDEPYRLGSKLVRGRLLIPSGIRCTRASTIERCFRENPSVGVITTKSISAQPRKGYREPIYARYATGCYINAVGLANPGAEAFLSELKSIAVPEDKFLLVSIFGGDIASFLEAARILKPVADGFELNMSCPHAKGYGAEVGQDTELLRKITEAVVEAAGVPVLVKLSAILADLAGTAKVAVRAGAAGITVTNTIGPAMAAVGPGPILYNRVGGLSGDGIRPMGLRAVAQVRAAVGPEPVVIGMGGIASAEHVVQHIHAGADIFGIGSALTGMDGAAMQQRLAELHAGLCGNAAEGGVHTCESCTCMEYTRTRVRSRVDYDEALFKLNLEDLPGQFQDGELAGRFFFLCLPGVGEKPFAVFSASEKSVVVRAAGEFTRRLAELAPGAELLIRGPYGKGVPSFRDSLVIHVGGGTGIASLLEIAHKLKDGNRQIFLLGAKTSKQHFDLDRFAALGQVLVSTDDGTEGRHGYASDFIQEALAGVSLGDRSKLVFVNCGPEPMVRKCFETQAGLTSDDRIIGSIEYMTSCGVGICGKCASPSGALSCVDGPFMPLREFQAAKPR